MKLSTRGRYSVTALYELALHYGERVVPLKAIAKTQGLSENYLEQLMSPLRRAGLVAGRLYACTAPRGGDDRADHHGGGGTDCSRGLPFDECGGGRPELRACGKLRDASDLGRSL